MFVHTWKITKVCFDINLAVHICKISSLTQCFQVSGGKNSRGDTGETQIHRLWLTNFLHRDYWRIDMIFSLFTEAVQHLYMKCLRQTKNSWGNSRGIQTHDLLLKQESSRFEPHPSQLWMLFTDTQMFWINSTDLNLWGAKLFYVCCNTNSQHNVS